MNLSLVQKARIHMHLSIYFLTNKHRTVDRLRSVAKKYGGKHQIGSPNALAR
jgi:hypothetical protein